MCRDRNEVHVSHGQVKTGGERAKTLDLQSFSVRKFTSIDGLLYASNEIATNNLLMLIRLDKVVEVHYLLVQPRNMLVTGYTS